MAVLGRSSRRHRPRSRDRPPTPAPAGPARSMYTRFFTLTPARCATPRRLRPASARLRPGASPAVGWPILRSRRVRSNWASSRRRSSSSHRSLVPRVAFFYTRISCLLSRLRSDEYYASSRPERTGKRGFFPVGAPAEPSLGCLRVSVLYALDVADRLARAQDPETWRQWKSEGDTWHPVRLGIRPGPHADRLRSWRSRRELEVRLGPQ